MVLGPGDLHLRTGEIEIAGHEEKALPARRNHFFRDPSIAQQRTVHTLIFDAFKAEAARGIGLRVEIHQEDAMPEIGETRGEIHGSRGLADATFLIGDRDDFHWAAECRRVRADGKRKKLRVAAEC